MAFGTEPKSLHGYLRPSSTFGAEEPEAPRAPLTAGVLVGWALVAGITSAMFLGVLNMKRGR